MSYINIIDTIKDIFPENNNICSCGKEHNMFTKEIYIGADACECIIEFINANFGGNSRGIIICDKNTYKASEKLIDFLSQNCTPVILDIKSFHADMIMLDNARAKIKELDCEFDFLIAAGSGTIHDITRVIAENTAKPFISYPTAASVDGYVSNVAPVTADGMKITLQAASPIALFADSEVICAAPKRLTASGAGDILGKYISLADWKIANLLIGEYICDKIVELQYAAVKKAKDSLSNNVSHETLCVNLLEALVISGICMQISKNSRPASGAEHHIAHFYEMDIITSFNGLHGENVGVGSILCSEVYHKFVETPDNNIIFARNLNAYEPDYALIKTYYKDLYDEIVKQNRPNELIKVTPEIFYEKLDKIKAIIRGIPTKAELIKLLNTVSGVTHLNHFGIDNADEIENLALKLAPYIRNRFTLLKLFRLIDLM